MSLFIVIWHINIVSRITLISYVIIWCIPIINHRSIDIYFKRNRFHLPYYLTLVLLLVDILIQRFIKMYVCRHLRCPYLKKLGTALRCFFSYFESRFCSKATINDNNMIWKRPKIVSLMSKHFDKKFTNKNNLIVLINDR